MTRLVAAGRIRTTALAGEDTMATSRTTIWQEQINVQIRQIATEEFKAFLQEQRPAIAKQIRTALGGSHKAIIDGLVEKMCNGVTNVSVGLHWPASS